MTIRAQIEAWIPVKFRSSLIERVDRVRGDVPRQKWFARAAEAALEVVEGRPPAPGPPAPSQRRAELQARQDKLNKSKGL